MVLMILMVYDNVGEDTDGDGDDDDDDVGDIESPNMQNLVSQRPKPPTCGDSETSVRL